MNKESVKVYKEGIPHSPETTKVKRQNWWGNN